MTATDTLTLGADLNVGSNVAGGQGSLSVKSLAGGGKIIFADPAWQNGSTAADASRIAVEDFGVGTLTEINAQFIAGQNSHIALGTDNTAWLTGKIADATAAGAGTWGENTNTNPNTITAAFGVNKAFTVNNNGSVDVDGSFTEASHSTIAAGNARFADNSLFVVDVNGLRDDDGVADEVALTVGGTKSITVLPGAKLLLSNVRVNDVVKVASTNGVALNLTIDSGSWGVSGGSKPTEKTIFFDNLFMSGGMVNADDMATVTVSAVDANTALPELDNSLGGLVNALMNSPAYSDPNNMGAEFIKKASLASDLRFGLALHIGGGDTDSTGDFN